MKTSVVADAYRRAVVAFAFAAPVVVALAPKGVVAALAIAGAVGAIAWASGDRRRPTVDRYVVFLLAALGLWMAIAAAWAPAPADALAGVAGLAAVVFAGVGAIWAAGRLDAKYRSAAEIALFAGMVVGLVALVAGVAYAKFTGDSLWGRFNVDPLTTLKTGSVALGLVAWPAVAAAWRRGQRAAAMVGGLAVYVVGALVSSAAAVLAPLVGLVAFAIVRLWGRQGTWLLAVVAVAVALTAPQILSSRPLKELAAGVGAVTSTSPGHRLEIWSFVAGKIDQRPIWGWGMDSSRAIPGGHGLLRPDVEVLPLHPHNAFLQVRLELGVPGAVIFALLVGAFFVRVAGGAEDRFAGGVVAGTASAYLTVASVSYGSWQNWWVAFAWALAVLTAMVLQRTRADTGPDHQAGRRP